jgi:D-methionine transport system permease protein
MIILAKYEVDVGKLLQATYETILLVLIPLGFIIVLGFIFGYLLFITSDTGIIKRNKFVKVINFILICIVDIARSIPFLILIFAVIPFTTAIMGTMLGIKGAIPALVISASPFFARIVYNALNETSKGVIEALLAFGASLKKITIILIRETLPSLIRGFTIMIITLVGFVAGAGAVGAGGLGYYAKQRTTVLDYVSTFWAVVIILVIVFIFQLTGDYIAKKIDKR